MFDKFLVIVSLYRNQQLIFIFEEIFLEFRFIARDFGKGKYRIRLVNNELLRTSAVIANCFTLSVTLLWQWRCNTKLPSQPVRKTGQQLAQKGSCSLCT